MTASGPGHRATPPAHPSPGGPDGGPDGAQASADALRAEILAQVARRGAGKSICPSEVARALTEDWRPLMRAVRAEAARLAGEGRIAILRKGKPIDPAEMRGVIRLGLPRQG